MTEPVKRAPWSWVDLPVIIVALAIIPTGIWLLYQAG